MFRSLIAGVFALATLLLSLTAVLAEQTPFVDEVYGDDQAAPVDEPLAAGRIVAVNAAASSVTLEFRPIPQLFLDGGIRSFRVEKPQELIGLQPGDKVRFEIRRDGRSYIVTRIENSNN